MRIVDIRQKIVPLAATTRNVGIVFGGITASAGAIVSDVIRGGVVPGLRAALFEHCIYDERGQPVDREPHRLPRAHGR